jgi:hypothetical protein
MTWFLQSKIRKKKKKVMELQRQLAYETQQYNLLIMEYKSQNSFMSIGAEDPKLKDLQGSDSQELTI